MLILVGTDLVFYLLQNVTLQLFRGIMYFSSINFARHFYMQGFLTIFNVPVF